MNSVLETLLCNPVIAILRGVYPEQAVHTCEQLYECGIRVVEIPLNSPDPLLSIERVRSHFSDRLVCGAGTVTQNQQVAQVAKAGGQLILSPNCDPDVISTTLDCGLLSIPGVATASEAFNALNAGAQCLKLFPAKQLGADYLKALKAVLPEKTVCVPVGGIDLDNMHQWFDAGAQAVGLGNSLYDANQTPCQWSAKLEKLRGSLQRLGHGRV